MSQHLSESFFGIQLSTFRDLGSSSSAASFAGSQHGEGGGAYTEVHFPYAMLISAVSILFFRTTIHQRDEPRLLRWFFGTLLAFLAYSNKSYELISAVEIFSYAVPFLLYSDAVGAVFPLGTQRRRLRQHEQQPIQESPTPSQRPGVLLDNSKAVRIALVAMSGMMCLVTCHLVATGALMQAAALLTPVAVVEGLAVLFPIDEVSAAYRIMDGFIYEEGLLKAQVARLFFITLHIQVGIGYLGIDFLKREQERRNQLVRMDMGSMEDDDGGDDEGTNTDGGAAGTGVGGSGAAATMTGNSEDRAGRSSLAAATRRKEKQKAKMMKQAVKFQRTAAPFIFFAAVPYMIEVIVYGNLNAFAFTCFKDDVHRAVRLYDLFGHDNNLVALAEHSAKAPADFAGYMDTVVTTTYDLFNRKFFSLPKVILLPMVMGRQPKMIAQIFPVIFFTDWLKGRAVSYMTHRIEQLEKETQDLNAVRSKVEQFDMKNAELLQRAGPGATDFTRRRWQDLTVQVQMKKVASELTTRTKGFFAFIQRNFVFSVLVDCALAQLMAVGKLASADIFVISRAIEDAVDMVLMRSRSEAELARMMTQIDLLKELAQVWQLAEDRNLIPCNVAPRSVTEHAVDTHASLVVLRNLLYSRGTAVVRADHMELPAGIYALTGANGSGKSTLFRVLMSCNTNERPIDLPPSIVLSTPIEPLIEEDDIQRETSCEAADEVVEISTSSPEDAGQSGQRNLGSSSNTVAEEEISGDGTMTTTMTTTTTMTISKGPVPEKDTPTSMNIIAHPRLSITMPSSRVAEISQTFYWPLYSKPIDWIYQHHISDSLSPQELDGHSRRVAELLHSLEFTQSLDLGDDARTAGKGESTDEGAVSGAAASDAIAGIMEQLVEEKEDWFNDLSGGQKSKVELVRKVFLMEECPHVLLVDETMAPLDPRSKSLVMAKLKAFCSSSVIIVIYHTDVGRESEDEEGEMVECVPSNDFFDGNIHVENKVMHLRPVC